MSYSLVSAATFHQADEKIQQCARGRQCVPTCLMFLITAEYFSRASEIGSSDLTDILFAGSTLYCAITHTSKNILPDFLHPTQLPVRIRYKGKLIGIKHKVTYSGVFQTIDGAPVDGTNSFTLRDAVLKCLTKSIILVFSAVSVGIYYSEEKLFVFDSHSRDIHGMSCADGTCVLGSFDSVDELCSYIEQLALSLCRVDSGNIQFDLHGFKLKLRKVPLCSPTIEILGVGHKYRLKENRKVIAVKRNVQGSDSCDCSNNEVKKVQPLLQENNLPDFADERHVDTGTSEPEIVSGVGAIKDICKEFHSVVSCCTRQKAVVYDASQFPGNSRSFTKSNIEVTPEIEACVRQIVDPPPADVFTLQQGLCSPQKTVVSIKGQIIQEDQEREVQVRNSPTSVKDIYITDTTKEKNDDEATHCRNPWHKKWGNNDTILKNPSQVPRIALFTFQLLGYKPLGRKSKKSGSHKFCVTCITRASNLTVEEFKELEVQAKSNWKHETYTETSSEQFNHPKCQNLSRKQSENSQIQAHLDKLEKLNIGETEKARQVKQLRMLAFVNPGKFMDDFDPERSEREMKKMNRRLHKEKNLKKNQLYDEDGVMIGTGNDLCDCLDVECVGCHFPCPKCKSEKCGGECRCSRKWMYEYIESEGTGITYSANT